QDADRTARRPEAVVDIGDQHALAAAGQHRVQRRIPTGGDAVADRRWYADDALAHQACHDARHRRVHAGDRDDDVVTGDVVDAIEQPPQPGNADIDDQAADDAGEVERALRLARDPEVRRAGGHDGDATGPGRHRAVQDGGGRDRLVVQHGGE